MFKLTQNDNTNFHIFIRHIPRLHLVCWSDSPSLVRKDLSKSAQIWCTFHSSCAAVYFIPNCVTFNKKCPTNHSIVFHKNSSSMEHQYHYMLMVIKMISNQFHFTNNLYIWWKGADYRSFWAKNRSIKKKNPINTN